MARRRWRRGRGREEGNGVWARGRRGCSRVSTFSRRRKRDEETEEEEEEEVGRFSIRTGKPEVATIIELHGGGEDAARCCFVADADEPTERAGCEFNWTECLDEPREGLRKKSSLYSTVSLVSLLASTLPACRGARRVEFPQESASSFRFSPPPPR